MNNITVIKRNGKREPLNIEKIKKQINFACKNTGIDPLDFERELKLVIVDGIKTSDIQNTIINTARRLASHENTRWIKVAGRAKMWDIYSNVYKITGFNLDQWQEHIEWLVDNKYYKKEVLQKLREFNIEPDFMDFGVITNIGKDNYDFETMYSRPAILETSYLIKDIDDNIVEYPFIMDIANALLLAETKEIFYKLFRLLHYRYIQLATPFQRNLRRPNGSLGSCFIGESDDSLASIFKSYTDMAFISKNGGGIGWDLSKIRPSCAVSENIRKANDIALWVKIINDICIAVNQAGVRKGAITVALPWWHYDIESFMEIRREDNGELRFKSFDVFPQPVIDSWLIEKCDKNEDVYLFDHYEFKNITGIDITELIDDELKEAYKQVEELIRDKKLKHYKKIRARKLWQKIFDNWIAIGNFYFSHKDNLNKSNYLKYDPDGGITKCANLCQESFSLTKVARRWKEEGINGTRVTTETDGMYHSCNLSSLNVAKFIDLTNEEIGEIVRWGVYILDRSIDLTNFPVLEAERGSKSLRNIGLGVVGLADYMAWNKVTYDTEEGRRVGQALIEKIAYYAYNASVELAKEKGSYPLFKPENYEKGLFGYTYEELDRLSRDETGNNIDWSSMKDKIQNNGIRNFLLLAFAPNTSTSWLTCSTASYQPAHERFFVETKEGAIAEIVPTYIEERYWYYKPKHHYRVKDIIEFTRRIQKFVDTGISLELVINPDIDKTGRDISKPIFEGFKAGEIKSIYYSRTLGKSDKKEKIKNDSETCVGCAN